MDVWAEEFNKFRYTRAHPENVSLSCGGLESSRFRSCTARVSQAMELEFAFFDAQIQQSTADDRPTQSPSAHTAGPQSSSVEPRGEDDRGRGHFRGVHESVSLLCVDFDDTLTNGDTTGLLVETAKAQVSFRCN